jgi:hypothetical protein
MVAQIGVLAEEKNDIDVLYQLTCKVIDERSFRFSKFVGHGCGKLRRKCSAWAQNLLRRGCRYLVVMHDLDREDESALRQQLEGAIRGLSYDASLILIPIEELEAWLLCDAHALKRVFSMKKLPRTPIHPEGITGPKEHLRSLVKKSCGKYYFNTIHNEKIASNMTVANLESCPSFSPYPEFLQGIMKKQNIRDG